MKEYSMEGGKVNMCKGLRDWLAEELAEGTAKEKVEDILDFLEDIGTVSEELQNRIKSERDMKVLKRWLKLAAKSETVEEFIRRM